MIQYPEFWGFVNGIVAFILWVSREVESFFSGFLVFWGGEGGI